MIYESNYLSHYGKGHLDGGHSGRYPWGSGKNPHQNVNVREEKKQTPTEPKWPEGTGSAAKACASVLRSTYKDVDGSVKKGFDIDPILEIYGENCCNAAVSFYLRQAGFDVYPEGYVPSKKKYIGDRYVKEDGTTNSPYDSISKIFGTDSDGKTDWKVAKDFKDMHVCEWEKGSWKSWTTDFNMDLNGKKFREHLDGRIAEGETGVAILGWSTGYDTNHCITYRKIDGELYFIDPQRGCWHEASTILSKIRQLDLYSIDQTKVDSHVAKRAKSMNVTVDKPGFSETALEILGDKYKLVDEFKHSLENGGGDALYYETENLSHHGIIGQKWGVRRYQNKDGTLTAEGKKRVKELKGKDESSLSSSDKKLIEASKKETRDRLQKGKDDKAKQIKEAEQRKKDVEQGKIKVEDMTSEELKSRMERLQLEKDYKTLMTESKSKDGELNMSKRFADRFKKSLVDKLASDVGADLIAQTAKATLAAMINKAAEKEVVDENGKKKTVANTIVFTNNQKKK